MFKKFKILSLCSLLMAGNGIRAFDAELKKAICIMGVAGLVAMYKSESNTERVVRGTYLGAVTAFMAILLQKQQMSDSEKNFAFMVAAVPMWVMMAASEGFLGWKELYLKRNLGDCDRILSAPSRELIKDYKRLEVISKQPENYGDYSELVIKVGQAIKRINREYLARDCKKLSRLIKDAAEKNYAENNPFLFNKIVRRYKILRDIQEGAYPDAVRVYLDSICKEDKVNAIQTN